MTIKNILKLVGILMLLVALSACGSDGNSNTNGTLKLEVTTTNLTGGIYNVLGKATFSKAVPGLV